MNRSGIGRFQLMKLTPIDCKICASENPANNNLLWRSDIICKDNRENNQIMQ